MASQGVVIALDMLFLGLLGSSPSLFIPHAWLLIAVLAALALPQLGIEWTSLRWRFDSLASDAKDEVSVNAIRHERPATHGVVATGKRNREAFEYLWEGVILPQCEKMRSANSGIHVDPYAKERVWERYVALNRHVSYTYMRHPDSLIDRHKVAACYSYAVLQAQPLHVTEETLASKPRASTANERLAMVVACSIVAAELRSVLRELDGIDDDCRASALERLDKGLRFPEHVGHGDYEESVLASLRHTRAEGTYNVLQYALLIFHWERCTFGDNVHRAILHHYRLLQKREHAPLD